MCFLGIHSFDGSVVNLMVVIAIFSSLNYIKSMVKPGQWNYDPGHQAGLQIAAARRVAAAMQVETPHGNGGSGR